MTACSSEILAILTERHPSIAKSKLIEMALTQFVNSQAELTDSELDETAKVIEAMSARAKFLAAKGAENESAAKVARDMNIVVGVLGRILARAIRLKSTGNVPTP